MGALGYGAAFERRVMPEDQHEDGRQQREELDDQDARHAERLCHVEIHLRVQDVVFHPFFVTS